MDNELRQQDDVAYEAQVATDEEALVAHRGAETIERNAQCRREQLNTQLFRRRLPREGEHELQRAQLITSMTSPVVAPPIALTTPPPGATSNHVSSIPCMPPVVGQPPLTSTPHHALPVVAPSTTVAKPLPGCDRTLRGCNAERSV